MGKAQSETRTVAIEKRETMFRPLREPKPYSPTDRDLAILRALPWKGDNGMAMVLGQKKDLDQFIEFDSARGGHLIKAIVNRTYTEFPVFRVLHGINKVPEQSYVTMRISHNVGYDQKKGSTYLLGKIDRPIFNVQIYPVNAKFSSVDGEPHLQGVYIDVLNEKDTLVFANDNRIMALPDGMTAELIETGHFRGPVIRSTLVPAETVDNLDEKALRDCVVLTLDEFNPHNVLHTKVGVREAYLKSMNVDNVPEDMLFDVAMGYDVKIDGVPMHYDNQFKQMRKNTSFGKITLRTNVEHEGVSNSHSNRVSIGG